MIFVRSALFNFLFYANTIVLMIVGLPTLIFGRRAVLALARLWSRLDGSGRAYASAVVPAACARNASAPADSCLARRSMS